MATFDSTPDVWRKATASGGTNCVEVAFDQQSVRMRQSRDPSQRLVFSHSEWDAFLASVRNGDFDRE
jgi:hypothetical protein